MPNGVFTEYAYHVASGVSGLTYKNGPNVLGTLTYVYDNAGNRGQVGGTWARTGLPQAVTSATYNAANHQLTFGGQSLTYDLNGNLTSDGSTTYTWDARNRLVSLSGPGVTASFQYDPLARRTRKVVNATTTDFLHDGVNPVQELSGASPLANILTGLGVDEYLTRTDSAGSRHFLTDALGSTVALTDPAGTVQTQYTYEPFGATTATGPTSGNSFQYTGREHDGTGLYYYRARYYHPTRQRFISEDPIGLLAGDMNFFAYVRNNPLTFVDPLGLDKNSGCRGLPLRGPAVGYYDLNFGIGVPLFGIPLGVTFGGMLHGNRIYPYFGGGAMTPGFTFLFTGSPNNPAPGYYGAFQAQAGAGFQVGTNLQDVRDYFWEVGGGWGFPSPVGASLTGYKVFQPIC